MTDSSGTVWFYYGNTLTGFGTWVGAQMTSLSVGLWNFINSIFGNLFVNVEFTTFVDSIKESPIVSTLISLTTILSVAFIIIKYGYVIFKAYFLNIDGQTAVPTMDFFKRVLYAFIMVLIAPTLVCNLFLFATYGGQAVSNALISKDITKDNADFYIKSFYRDAQEYGIEPLTICYDNLDDWDVTELKEVSDLGFPKVIIKDDVNSNPDNIYDKWCGKTLTNKEEGWEGKKAGVIMQTLMDDNKQPWIYHWVKGFDPMNLLQLAIIIISSIAIIIMTVLRISDLLAAILMMWYYAQAYVSEVNNTMIGSFVKKITAVCMTQFFTISMYGIITSMLINNEDFNFNKFLILAALVFMMIKGPSTIRGIMQDSGALGATTSASKTARRALGG